eukprot:scaffold12.g8184.t1
MLSSSFKDVAAIAPVPTQPLSKLTLGGVGGLSDSLRAGGSGHGGSAFKRSTASAMLQEKYNIRAVQESENDQAEIVIVCEPEGQSLQMGGLHPRASLYEKPVNLEAAKQAHAEFRRVMRDMGVRVLTVRRGRAEQSTPVGRLDREILAYGAGQHALTYKLAEGAVREDIEEKDRHYLSDAYKRTVLEHMSLIDTILTNPTVHLAPSYRDTGLTATYRRGWSGARAVGFEPLSNLVYTRDQQITTCRGIVMGRLRSPQRSLEVSLMRFCLQKLGLPVVGEIAEGGFLEGGDFFPAGRDLALLGIGLRSNFSACQQLMDRDLLGTRRFAVVRDDFEQHQDRMHLDCVFRRVVPHVDEYAKGPDGKYALTRQGVEFRQYMVDNGYHIIPIKSKHQLEYGCNCLNLGNERIISVHMETARQLVRGGRFGGVQDPHFTGDVRVIDYSPITSMYGAVHCSSQVVKRTPRR